MTNSAIDRAVGLQTKKGFDNDKHFWALILQRETPERRPISCNQQWLVVVILVAAAYARARGVVTGVGELRIDNTQSRAYTHGPFIQCKDKRSLSFEQASLTEKDNKTHFIILQTGCCVWKSAQTSSAGNWAIHASQ